MIPAQLYNVPTLHYAFEFELLCNNVAARLLQGCHKVETVSNPKLFQGCGQVVTTLCNNLVTRLPHPCHKLGISVWELTVHLHACFSSLSVCGITSCAFSIEWWDYRLVLRL